MLANAAFRSSVTQDAQLGRERFDIYCAVCHGRTGEGNGMIVQRGFPSPPSYHIDRLRNAPPGYIYNVITNGYGVMYSYAGRIAPRDRWAIAAYIRALQLSQNAKQSDVPAGQHVEDLHQIANVQGMPPGFADPWGMPATAVYGTPNGQDNGIPGLGTTTAPAGAQSHGSNAGGQPSGTGNSSGPPLAKPDAEAPGKLAGPQH